jgi:hypothetical protein
MKKSALLKVLIAEIASVAIACATKPALAQHTGHMGGSGFHGGGFHGGGFHGGPGFAGGFHAGGHGGFHGAAGFPIGVHAGYWHGGYWGYPRYGYGWGFGIGIGIDFGWGSYWALPPYPYYGYSPYYAYPYCGYYPPYYYPPYPYRYYPYYPISRSYVYSGGASDGDRESQLVQRYASDRTNYRFAEYQVENSDLRHLPPERRRLVQNVIRALRAMPPDARQRQIDAGRFRNFSPEEQELLNKPAPLSAARVQPAQSVPRPPQRSAIARRPSGPIPAPFPF